LTKKTPKKQIQDAEKIGAKHLKKSSAWCIIMLEKMLQALFCLRFER
jgi:hypothetical protein